ncbi:MAG: hypothetical protein PVI01_17610 [Gemmatimonadales bacterium]|jgi:hypothetical protein
MKPARRIIVVLTIALLSAPLSGCGDDPISPQEILAGTWNCTKYEITYSDGIVFDVLNSVDSFTLTFTRDRTYTAVLIEDGTPIDNATGQYSATSSRISFDPGELSEFTLNYSISGDVLTMTGIVTGDEYDMRFVRA